MKNKSHAIIKVLAIVGWILSVLLSFYVGMLVQWASSTELEMTKDYAEITVAADEIIDYSAFLNIPEKYKVLEQIDEPIRKTIALYMEANHLKLAEGTHRFCREGGSLDQYLTQDFRFEPIE